MANDLRIPVTVGDGFTGPLAKLRNEMQRVSDASGIKALNADWKRVQGNVVNVGREVASLTPAFNGLGVASMGLGAGIAAASIAVRNFALGTRDMSMFGKETGFTIDKLRTLEAVGNRYGITADQVRSNAQGAADNFDQIRRRIGGLYQDLRSRGEFNLAENLVGAKDVEGYMDRVFDAATRMSNPKRRQEFLKNALGSDDFSKVIEELGPRWRQLFEEVQQRIGKTTPAAVKAANDFNRALSELNETMIGLRNEAMTPLLEATTQLITEWEKPIKGSIADFARDMKNILDGMNAAGTAWKEGNYFGAIKALNGGQPIFKDLSTPLAGTEMKAVSARMDRLAAASQQLEKLNSALDSGKISPGARDNVIAQRDKLQDEIKRLTDELAKFREQGPTIQQQSFNGGGGFGAGLIQNASFGGFGGGQGSPMGQGGIVGGMKAWAGFLRRQRETLDAANGAAVSVPSSAMTPRGDGSGTRGAATTGQMMAWAMDQLRREGVPEANLRTAAAHLVGQATMESGLNPNLKHDYDPKQGRYTGFGIYGARDPKPGQGRMTDMLKWLEANGYARNSAEGQMREMAHSAVSGKYGPTRNVLFGRGTGNLETDTNIITRNFENPKFVNRRSHAVANALRIGPDGTVSKGGGGIFASDANAKEKDVNYPYPFNMKYRGGDEMMQVASRAFGGLQNPAKVEGSAKLTIDINGLPSPNYRARTSMDGMFKDVRLNAGKTQMLPESGVDI